MASLSILSSISDYWRLLNCDYWRPFNCCLVANLQPILLTTASFTKESSPDGCGEGGGNEISIKDFYLGKALRQDSAGLA